MQAAATFVVCSQVVKRDVESGWLRHSFETGARTSGQEMFMKIQVRHRPQAVVIAVEALSTQSQYRSDVGYRKTHSVYVRVPTATS